MRLDEIVAWYQKKIGTYDKQQWEKTVEQKILDGFSSVTLKTAKLKTELIDVDLVRGSTFPKAKAKQSLITVIRLAILRYLFLPIYTQWWVKQTSPNIFAILLMVYITQMINWAVYTYNIHRLELQQEPHDSVTSINATFVNGIAVDNGDDGVADGKQADEHIVLLSDLLIPMALSFLLSLIHSQIVATNTQNSSKVKRRRFSNANQAAGATAGKNHHRLGVGEQRLRRRKKLVKVRSQDIADTQQQQQQQQPPQQQRLTNALKLYQSSIDNSNMNQIQLLNVPFETNSAVAMNSSQAKTCSSYIKPTTPTTDSNYTLTTPHNAICNLENFNTSSAVRINTYTSPNTPTAAPSSTINHDLHSSAQSIVSLSTAIGEDNHSNLVQKKRNVNWHSPIHNYAVGETQEKEQQTSPQTMSSSTSASDTNAIDGTGSSSGNGAVNDDGRCSVAVNATEGSSSSASVSPSKTVRIDDCVREFYDELLTRSDSPSKTSSAVTITKSTTAADGHEVVNHNTFSTAAKRSIGDDDGFESLNGKSSSGEENNSVMPSTSAATLMKNQLRLRLNTTAEYKEANSNKVDTDKEAEKITSTTYCSNLSGDAIFVDRNRSTASKCSDATSSYQQAKKERQTRIHAGSTDETEEEGDDGEALSSPATLLSSSNYNECTTSATEWLGITTNSEECSYSSELDNSDGGGYKNHQISDEDGYDLDFTPQTILNAHGTTDRISCTIWEQRDIKKAQMSVLEISSCIIERVESMPETNDYIYIGVCFSFLLSLIPVLCRLCEATMDADKSNEISYFEVPMLLWEKASFSICTIFHFAFGHTQWERTVLVIGLMQRLCLSMILFIIFAVAERTFKQRFLYAKLFSHLTSSRRARKSNLPHFRLNKVRNIKTWLSVRSYLKKRGPQRSVDVIVSAAFIVTLFLLAFLSVEWLKDSVQLHSHLNLEALMWSTTIGIFLLRFMTLGNKIHHKYRSVSVLITEQINLYLQIEQKPKKKEELMVANSVLKLAADLLKELESPFKISGFSANPYLFTTVKVVILSALSGVLSEMLGFKLKLHKIKIK